MSEFKKKKLNCVVCGVAVRVNVDQTCGSPECKLKAHELFHRMIQETSQDVETKQRLEVFA